MSTDTEPEVTAPEEDFPEEVAAAVRADFERLEADPLFDGNRNVLHKYVRLRKRYEADLKHLEEGFEAMTAAVKEKLRGLEWQYGRHVESLLRKMLDGQPRRSVRTPWGTAGLRRSPSRLIVTDEAALKAAWEAGDLPREACRVKVEVEPEWKVLDELFRQDGEIPVGCEISQASERFFIR